MTATKAAPPPPPPLPVRDGSAARERAAGGGVSLSPMLTRLAAERATGVLEREHGTLHLAEGRVVHAESPLAPGLGDLLLAHGTIDADTWLRTLAEGPGGEYGAALRLLDSGRVARGALEVCHLGALCDAAYFALAPSSAPGRFRYGAALVPGLLSPDPLPDPLPDRFSDPLPDAVQSGRCPGGSSAGGLATDGLPATALAWGEASSGGLRPADLAWGTGPSADLPSGDPHSAHLTSGELSPGELLPGGLTSDDPSSYGLPSDGRPADDPSSGGMPSGDRASGTWAFHGRGSGGRSCVAHAPGDRASGYQTSGDRASGDQASGWGRAGGAHPHVLGSIAVAALQRATLRRRALLDRLWPQQLADTAPLLRTGAAAVSAATARHGAVLALVDGERTASDIARALGRRACPTLADVRRLAAAGLVSPKPPPVVPPPPHRPHRPPGPPGPPLPGAWPGGLPPVNDPDITLLKRLRDALEAL